MIKILCGSLLTVILFFSLGARTADLVEIEVQDEKPFHIHLDGEVFSVLATFRSKKADAVVAYQWRDYSGRDISERKVVNLKDKREIKINSPDSKAGYYGLVFTPANKGIRLNDRYANEELEYGFGIVASGRKRTEGSQGRFGTVHTERDDPYMPDWIKTLTWKTADAGYWATVIKERNEQQLSELPLIIEDEWQSKDSQPISVRQLRRLGKKVSQFFQADKNVLHWELGLEENLTGNFYEKYYWQNLASKAAVVRRAADQINPKIKLIYQIAELDLKPVRSFLKSSASQSFDILSLHPYQWPEFAPAETWLEAYLNDVRLEMREAKRELPIWFTEVGAPHHGNHPEYFFGYPDNNVAVEGLTRARSVSFMIKLHVVALEQGVEKIFWYNYKDRESDRKYAENHFALVDFWGYPKPVYLAYANLYDRLKGKKSIHKKVINEHVFVYTFEDDTEQVEVVWTSDEETKNISLNDLGYEGDVKQLKLTNSVGTAEELKQDSISISQFPVYLTKPK